jgi:hypothetical protein
LPKVNDPTQEPFRKYNLEKKVDTFTVKLNEEERQFLEKLKVIIEQPKDSTALKQLAWFGAKVILSDSTSYLLDTCFKNRTKNKRIGIDLSL